MTRTRRIHSDIGQCRFGRRPVKSLVQSQLHVDRFSFCSFRLDIPMNEERKRTAYREKITECINRAEQLKEFVQQQKGRIVSSRR
jgi:hypothetical protein